MGVPSSESHDLTAFYEMLSASFGVLSQNTGFYPSLDRIVETMLGPLNLGPGGRSYNEPISHLQRFSSYRGNPGTSFTDLDPEGDLPLFPCLGFLAARLAVKYLMASRLCLASSCLSSFGEVFIPWVVCGSQMLV